MKKLRKSTIAIITAIAVLGVTVLTLGLIRVNPNKYFFDSYKYFQVYDLGAASPYPSVEEKIAPSLSSVSFSVLGAVLEGQGSYSPKIVKDDEGDPAYLGIANIKNMAATSSRYLLHFIYDKTKTIKVDGKEYEYNRAFVFIQEGSGEVVEVRVIPYVFERVYDNSNGADSADFYEIPDLRIKMRTAKLYNAISTAISEF